MLKRDAYFLIKWERLRSYARNIRSHTTIFSDRGTRRPEFGPRYTITFDLDTLQNKELNDLYSSPNIIRVIKSRRMRWAGHVARMGERRGVYRVLVGEPEGKRPLGRPRRRWEDNIEMDLQEVACEGTDCINLVQDRDGWRVLANAVLNFRVP